MLSCFFSPRSHLNTCSVPDNVEDGAGSRRGNGGGYCTGEVHPGGIVGCAVEYTSCAGAGRPTVRHCQSGMYSDVPWLSVTLMSHSGCKLRRKAHTKACCIVQVASSRTKARWHSIRSVAASLPYRVIITLFSAFREP